MPVPTRVNNNRTRCAAGSWSADCVISTGFGHAGCVPVVSLLPSALHIQVQAQSCALDVQQGRRYAQSKTDSCHVTATAQLDSSLAGKECVCRSPLSFPSPPPFASSFPSPFASPSRPLPSSPSHRSFEPTTGASQDCILNRPVVTTHEASLLGQRLCVFYMSHVFLAGGAQVLDPGQSTEQAVWQGTH